MTHFPFSSSKVAPPDANTLLQCLFNGANASTAFTDDTGRHTLAAQNEAALSTAQKDEGSASLRLDGTDDYVTVADSADWALGSAFTLELSARFDSVSTRPMLVGQYVDDNNLWWWRCRFASGDAGMEFRVVEGGTETIYLDDGTPTGWSVDTWYDLCLERNSSGTIRLYRDGTVLNSGVATSTVPNLAASLAIGQNIGSGTFLTTYFPGYIDKLRLSNVARYDGAYTPGPF